MKRIKFLPIRLSPKQTFTATAIVLSVMLAACNNTSSSTPKNTGKKADSNLLAQQVKPRITAAELDGATMRVNYFHVSYVEVGRLKYPILNFSFPEKADSVQIMRCRSDAKLGDLENIEIGASNTAAADQKYKNTDYWKEISTTFGCILITNGVSIDKHVDYFAGDGSWVYVGRACVQSSRLPTDGSETTVSPCSRQVSKSSELRGYINKQKAISAEKKSQLIAQRDKVDALGRAMVYKAKQLDTEISRCEAERGANKVSQRRRAAIGDLLKVGIGLGSKMIADPATQSLIGGLDIGGIFKGLTAQPGDYLPADFCPAADRLTKDLEIDKQQLEIESEDYKESLKLFGESV